MTVESAAPRWRRRHLLYNAASLACFAVAGLSANLMIARFYGPAITGLFNQVLAFYLVASQFAVFGIHLAALRRASLLPQPARVQDVAALIANALAVASSTALIAIGAGYLFSLAIPALFTAQGLRAAWLLALPGLYFLALNKVLIGIANGLERYAVFAVAQSGRPVLFLLLCWLWIALGWSGQTIAFALSLAEFILSLVLLAYFAGADGPLRPLGLLREGPRLLGFGMRALPGSAFADLNTRIDIIVLGLFVPAAATGVYTIAAWIAEGALQVPAAVRPLISARIAQLAAAGRHDELARLIRRVGFSVMAATAALLTGICLGFPFVAEHVLVDPRYRAALQPLLILSVGVVLGSYYLPFDFMLGQSGRPLSQSGVRGTMILVNITLALILVPLLGTVGAALAYSLSFVAYAASFRFAARELFAGRA